MDLRSVFGASDQLKGIACLLASGVIFSFTDAMSKLLTSTYPTGQIIFFRTLFVLIPIAIMVWRKGGFESLRSRNIRGQLARGTLVVCTSFIFMTAITFMPLADVIAILFVSPLVLTALAPFFLGEHVGWRRWTAVAIGFSGTLLMIRPSGDTPLWPALLVLLMTLFIAFRDILTRQLSKTDSANATMVWSTACVSVGGLSTYFLGSHGGTIIEPWVMLDWRGIGLLAMTGTLQGVAQYFLITAFIFGEAVVIVPFRYFSLIWATIYGYLFFGDIPRPLTLLGAAIVIGSGLFILYREAKLSGRLGGGGGTKNN